MAACPQALLESLLSLVNPLLQSLVRLVESPELLLDPFLVLLRECDSTALHVWVIELSQLVILLLEVCLAHVLWQVHQCQIGSSLGIRRDEGALLPRLLRARLFLIFARFFCFSALLGPSHALFKSLVVEVATRLGIT